MGQIIEHSAKRFVDHFWCRRKRLRRLAAVQRDEMLALCFIKAKRICQCIQHLRGRMDVAALLKPGVPGGADAYEHGEFFAPEPRCAAAEAFRQADIGRPQAFTARAQEGRKLAAAGFEHVQLLIHGHDHISIDTRIKSDLSAIFSRRMMRSSRQGKSGV